MSGQARTIGVILLGSLARPIALGSLVVAAVCLIGLVFQKFDFTLFVLFLVSSALAYLCLKTLQSIGRKGQSLLEKINRSENLSFNPNNLLGHPGPAFMAFDSANRKLVTCNSATGDYQVRDLDYILAWRTESSSANRMSVGISPGNGAPGRPLNATTTHSAYQTDFMLVLTVADENNPILKFPMASDAVAQRWSAILQAVINGR